MFNLNHSAHLGNAKLAQQAAEKTQSDVLPVRAILFLVLLLWVTLSNKHFAQKAEYYAESSGNQNH